MNVLILLIFKEFYISNFLIINFYVYFFLFNKICFQFFLLLKFFFMSNFIMFYFYPILILIIIIKIFYYSVMEKKTFAFVKLNIECESHSFILCNKE